MQLGTNFSHRLRVISRLTTCVALLGFVAWIGMIVACAPPAATPRAPERPQQIPVSAWGGRYSFNYAPPGKVETASANATILVVNPVYREPDSAFAGPTYLKVGKGFSASMGVDMDKILIAKGLTSKGPFASMDELTYSDKKISDLTLAPQVFITADVKYGQWQAASGNYQYEDRVLRVMFRSFELRVGGWVTFVMQEPLSGQKMWIKKLELEEKTVTGQEYCEGKPQYRGETYQTGNGSLFFPYENHTNQVFSGWQPGEILYSENQDGMANYIKEVYPMIMEKCWTYIDPAEINSLKEKVAEIRKMKVY
jgi:hypothetical protein